MRRWRHSSFLVRLPSSSTAVKVVHLIPLYLLILPLPVSSSSPLLLHLYLFLFLESMAKERGLAERPQPPPAGPQTSCEPRLPSFEPPPPCLARPPPPSAAAASQPAPTEVQPKKSYGHSKHPRIDISCAR